MENLINAERCLTILNELYEFSYISKFSKQIDIARELYFIFTGKVNDEDPFYEARMANFLEYFVFEYRLSELFSGSTLFELFLLENQKKMKVEEIFEYEQFRSIRRSLFKIIKNKQDYIIAKDLFSGEENIFYALTSYSFDIYNVGEIFEARSVCLNNELYLTGNFIFHPKEVKTIIENQINEYLYKKTNKHNKSTIDWRIELKRRHEILEALAEQKKLLEYAEKKKSIEMLNVNKNLSKIATQMSSEGVIMALGSEEFVSPFVPETAFYDLNAFLNKLAYCEIRCYRYKHISVQKIYSFDVDIMPANLFSFEQSVH